MFVYDNGQLLRPHYIINFPTKVHWRGSSKIEYVDEGLLDLRRVVNELGIKSIAIPPLGCGNGGLDWNDVRPRIEATFDDMPDVNVLLFEPGHSELRELPATGKPVQMTPGRAAVLLVMSAYREMLYPLSMLEVQKLTYFLSAAGEPLDLDFVKQKFGPYSNKLRHVLLSMDGSYVTGVGDLNAPSEISVVPDALDAAQEFLSSAPAMTTERVARVKNLIEGYESPYGLELLSTVHWAALEDAMQMQPDAVVERVQGWNERKKESMPPREIRYALARLHSQAWLSAPV
jgi:O-acetyl-ADP-ribose deacetylase (regulator of RNase III)